MHYVKFMPVYQPGHVELLSGYRPGAAGADEPGWNRHQADAVNSRERLQVTAGIAEDDKLVSVVLANERRQQPQAVIAQTGTPGSDEAGVETDPHGRISARAGSSAPIGG
jgi:hypothetical protein